MIGSLRSRLSLSLLTAALGGCGAHAKPVASSRLSAPARASSQQAPLAAATTPGSPETCSNAADDNRNGLIDEGCGMEMGLVQFIAGWGASRADVDLRVIDPNGELIEVARVARSGLTKDRDCPGRGNECQGRNLENVYLADGEPLKGEYRVRVRLEALGGENPPIRVTLGMRLGPQSRSYELLLETPATERELRFKL